MDTGHTDNTLLVAISGGDVVTDLLISLISL